MLLSLTRPVLLTAGLPASQLELAPTSSPQPSSQGDGHSPAMMSRNPAWLSLASLVPSRRPLCLPLCLLLCLGRMFRLPLHVPSLFIGFYLLDWVESMSSLLQKERKVRPLAASSARQLWGLGFQDQDLFAPGVKCVLSVWGPGRPHDRPPWASRRVCLHPLSSWLPWGMCPTSSGT